MVFVGSAFNIFGNITTYFSFCYFSTLNPPVEFFQFSFEFLLGFKKN